MSHFDTGYIPIHQWVVIEHRDGQLFRQCRLR